MKNFWLKNWWYLAGLIFVLVIFGWLLYQNLQMAAILILITAVGLLLINKPRLFFYFSLFSILAGQLVRIPVTSDQSGALLLSDLIIAVNLIIWLIDKIRRQERLPSSPINRWILFFVGFAAISLIFSSQYLVSGELIRASWYLVRWMLYAGFFYLTLDQIRSRQDWNKILTSVLAIGGLVAFFGLMQYALFPDFSQMAAKYGWDPHMYRVLSVFFDPNYTGGFLAIIFTLILSLYLNLKKGTAKLWLLVSLLVVLAALILTYSRSAYLTLAVMILVVFIFQARKLLLVFLALVLITTGVILSSEKVTERIQKRIEGASQIDITASARILSWSHAWKIIADQPLTGVGFNAYPQAQERYGFVRNLSGHSVAGSDSSLLNTWAMTGIFGLLSYLLIYFGVLRQGYWLMRQKRPELRGLGLGVLASLIGLLVHAQFVNSLYFPPIMMLFWVLAALVFRGQKVHETDEK